MPASCHDPAMRDSSSICLAVSGHGLGEGRCLCVIGSSDNSVLYSIWRCQLLSFLNWLVTPAGLDTASHESEKNLSTHAKIMVLFSPLFSLNRTFLLLLSFTAVPFFLTAHPYCYTNIFQRKFHIPQDILASWMSFQSIPCVLLPILGVIRERKTDAVAILAEVTLN